MQNDKKIILAVIRMNALITNSRNRIFYDRNLENSSTCSDGDGVKSICQPPSKLAIVGPTI